MATRLLLGEAHTIYSPFARYTERFALCMAWHCAPAYSLWVGNKAKGGGGGEAAAGSAAAPLLPRDDEHSGTECRRRAERNVSLRRSQHSCSNLAQATASLAGQAVAIRHAPH